MFLNTFSRFSFETHLHALALIKKTLPHTVNTRRMCTESWVCLGRRDTCRSVCKQEVKTISRTKWWKEENKTKSSLINRASDTWVQTQSQFFLTPHPSFPCARCFSEHSYGTREEFPMKRGQTFETLTIITYLGGRALTQTDTTRHFKYGVFSCRKNTLTRGSVQN